MVFCGDGKAKVLSLAWWTAWLGKPWWCMYEVEAIWQVCYLHDLGGKTSLPPSTNSLAKITTLFPEPPSHFFTPSHFTCAPIGSIWGALQTMVTLPLGLLYFLSGLFHASLFTQSLLCLLSPSFWFLLTISVSSCSLFESSQSLFWASFGGVGIDSFELTGIKSYTRFWGLLMFGSYSVINVIVLLNLLIAMMSNSYAMIDVSADAMWSHTTQFIYRKSLLVPSHNLCS